MVLATCRWSPEYDILVNALHRSGATDIETSSLSTEYTDALPAQTMMKPYSVPTGPVL